MNKPRRRRLKFMPSARLRRRAVRLFRRAPKTAQLLIVLTLAILLWLALNWMYQVVRKPSELFFPVSGTLNKTPARNLAAVRTAVQEEFHQRDFPRVARGARSG